MMNMLNQSALQAAQNRMTGADTMDADRMAALDAQAQEAGFKNYEQMKLYMLQRQQREGNASAPARPAPRAAPQPEQRAPQQGGGWHPRNVFNYIAEALGRANGD